MEDLEERTILTSKLRGKIKIYTISPTFLTKKYFILAETYKQISFLENKPLVKEIIKKILPSLKGAVLIFGSYAKGIEKKDSDLDIFTTRSYQKEKIKEVSNLYGIKINIKNYPEKIFQRESTDDFLLKEVLENHILIKDIETFIEKWIK